MLGRYYSTASRCVIYPHILLPTGNKERGVLGVASIPAAKLPFSQDMKTIVLQLHKHECNWVVNASEAVLEIQYCPVSS